MKIYVVFDINTAGQVRLSSIKCFIEQQTAFDYEDYLVGTTDGLWVYCLEREADEWKLPLQ